MLLLAFIQVCILRVNQFCSTINNKLYFQIILLKLFYSDDVSMWEQKASVFYVDYTYCNCVQ